MNNISHAGPRTGDFVVELIRLFQCQTICLVGHKINKENTKEAVPEPVEEDLGLHVYVLVGRRSHR
ncbi:hypothetical protein N7501_005818 [Penicillium viridicatum]|nr:hypothetical protein N7501_005818 [Penicillium viridicatum]